MRSAVHGDWGWARALRCYGRETEQAAAVSRRAAWGCSFDAALAAGCDAAGAVAGGGAPAPATHYTAECIRYMVEAGAADAVGAVDVVAVGSAVSVASGTYGASVEGGGCCDAWRDGH